MKRAVKKTVKRMVPGLADELNRLHAIDTRLAQAEQLLLNINHRVSTHDNRLDRLKSLAAQVEPYQPTYSVSNIFTEDPRRGSTDRCLAIEQFLGSARGLHILDIGSSIGYLCYYFADRGATCEGWESNSNNAEVARLVGEINGISVQFKTKEFNKDTVKTIPPNEFDIAVVLSVFHHITRFNGLEFTQKLVKELFERVPVLIVELAKKGEDSKLPWDKSQPDDELAIFDLVKGEIEIKKIGEFGNHLSKKTRPLYVVSKRKIVTVNGRNYAYDSSSVEAYKGSPVANFGVKRRYYFARNYVIKHYDFSAKSAEHNMGQILNEIQFFLNIAGKHKIHGAPKLLDFQVQGGGSYIVLERIPGELLVESLGEKQSAASTVKDVLTTLADLEKLGLHHNDVRSWNILYDGKKAALIDYGLVSSIQSDDDMISLLWVIDAIMTGEREGYELNKKLPPKKHFTLAGIGKIYDAVAKGERSAAKLLKLLH